MQGRNDVSKIRSVIFCNYTKTSILVWKYTGVVFVFANWQNANIVVCGGELNCVKINTGPIPLSPSIQGPNTHSVADLYTSMTPCYTYQCYLLFAWFTFLLYWVPVLEENKQVWNSRQWSEQVCKINSKSLHYIISYGPMEVLRFFFIFGSLFKPCCLYLPTYICTLSLSYTS